MPETNNVALGRGAPAVYSEPLSSEPPVPSSAEATMCVNPSAGGATAPGEVTGTGGSGAGAEELVRRFGGSEGAGANLDPEPEPTGGPSCSDDAIRAIGACGGAVVVGIASGGMAAVFAGMVCAGNLDGYLECLESAEDAKNAGIKP